MRKLRHASGFPILFGLLGIQGAVQAFPDESRDAHEVTFSTVVAALPGPLRPFFEANLRAFRAAGRAELTAVEWSDTDPAVKARHYVMLDVAASGADLGARLAEARQFPRARGAACKLFKLHRRDNGGELPWVIGERYRALTKAFEAGRFDAAVHEAGRLTHYATDAAMPFNTTADRDGLSTGQLSWSAEGAVPASLAHRTVRHRCQVGLLLAFRDRFQHEVRVWPERFTRLSDPIDAVFEELLAAHRALEPLLKTDAELTASLEIYDAAGFLAASEGYYGQLVDRAGPIIETRLEAGALLSANLIGTAWLEAGAPSLTRPIVAATTPEPQTAQKEEAAAPACVGSRHSTAFHLATCPHATRIKPENLVEFRTAEEARAAGRVPCKTCRPGGR